MAVETLCETEYSQSRLDLFLMKNLRYKDLEFWFYSILLFMTFVGVGEFLCRLNQNYSPLADSGYLPAIGQFQQIQDFAHKHGSPDCIFFGNSLVQTGIDPETFSKSFQSNRGEKIKCYNFGMSASTMTSTVPMAIITAEKFKPTYLIIGVQIFSFDSQTDTPSHVIEDNFQDDSWVKYSLGFFNPKGWLLDKSALYWKAKESAGRLFAQQGPDSRVQNKKENTTRPGTEQQKRNTIRPEIDQVVTENGYGPLLGYRDKSPMFQNIKLHTPTRIDPRDLAALDRVMQFTQQRNIHLILVEMPLNSLSEQAKNINKQIMVHANQQGVPYLSTEKLAHLPETAFSDQTHLHISGSKLFSEWLGTHLGKAAKDGSLSNISSPVWSPSLAAWPTPNYTATLGLTESNYQDYLKSYSKPNALPDSANIFNPSNKNMDKRFLQTSIGFMIEHGQKMTSPKRESLFRFINILGKMQYQNELHVSPDDNTELENWRLSLDPAIMDKLGIQYILCRTELASPNTNHCPDEIEQHAGYQMVDSWDFEPLYEKYTLYKVILHQ